MTSSIIITLIFFISIMANAGDFLNGVSSGPETLNFENCESILEGQWYLPSNRLRNHSNHRSLTLRPENQSLEMRNPQLAHELYRVFATLTRGLSQFKGSFDDQILFHALPMLDDIEARFQGADETIIRSITNSLRDTLTRHYRSAERSPISPLKEAKRQNLITSIVWETIVAVHFEATAIDFDQQFSRVYHDEHAEFRSATLNQLAQAYADPEIDFILHRADGTDVWVEVKNWSQTHIDEDKEFATVKVQCQRMGRARLLVKNKTIRTMLVIKFAPSDPQLLMKYLHAGCDLTVFMHP